MAKPLRVLAGQTVAITGAGRGIGRASASALAREGMRVAIGDVDLPAAEEVAREIGPSAVALSLDVTDRPSFVAFLDQAQRQLGPLDVLINNAGIMQLGRFMDEDDLTTRRMIDINLHGVILGMKLALELMTPRDRGHIVNIASQAGKYGAAGASTYSATKHAVVGLSEAVRAELRLMGSNVDLSYVLPYIVNTELGAGLGKARGLSNIEPEDVAGAVVEALKKGTVDVWVPKRSKSTLLIGGLLPRSLSEGVARLTGADSVLATIDVQARRDYELRAAHSEPGLEPIREPAQITERSDS